MAALVPQDVRHHSFLQTKPCYLHPIQIILRVVLTMGALCLMEVNLPIAQAQPDQRPSTMNEPASAPDDRTPASRQSDSTIPELELLKEEESVVLKEESASIARGMYPGKPQPISQAPSNVYVVTDEDIRHSGAIDLPTVLRRIPGIDVMQVTGADF